MLKTSSILWRNRKIASFTSPIQTLRLKATMAPILQEPADVSIESKCPFSKLPPVAPVLAKRNFDLDKEPDYDHADFIMPDLPSRCQWFLGADPATSPHTKEVQSLNKPKITPDVLHLIGNTPMVRINKIAKEEGIQCDLLAKCEFFSAAGSLKDRIGLRMIEDAEKAGVLKPGDTIIEPSSGNTGIVVALCGAVKGYRVIIVMPEKMSDEKANILRSLGAEIVRTPTTAPYDAPESSWAVAQRLHKKLPNSVILDQYRNASNPLAHYDTTAEEIIDQCDGKVDMVVLGAGTGGAVTGIGRKLKEKCPDCIIVGVDPEGSLMALPEALNNTKAKSWEVEGTGHDFLPTVLDRAVVDVWYKCSDRETFSMARRLIRDEGLLCGGSSGGSMAVALKAAKTLKPGQKCVAILADSVRNYMTKHLNDKWCMDRDFLAMDHEPTLFWHKDQVTSMTLCAPYKIMPNLTVEQTFDIMKDEGQEIVVAVDNLGNIAGVITMAGLRVKVAKGKCSPKDTIVKGLYEKVKKISADAPLKELSNIFDLNHYAAVVDSKDEIVGLVTGIDLMHHVAKLEAC